MYGLHWFFIFIFVMISTAFYKCESSKLMHQETKRFFFFFCQIAEEENLEADSKFRALVAIGSLVFIFFAWWWGVDHCYSLITLFIIMHESSG
jgi:hypothetical protein